MKKRFSSLLVLIALGAANTAFAAAAVYESDSTCLGSYQSAWDGENRGQVSALLSCGCRAPVDGPSYEMAL